MKNKLFTLFGIIVAVVGLSIGTLQWQAYAQQTECYGRQGGDKQTAASGCEYEFQSGATLDVQSGVSETHANDVTFSGTITTGAMSVNGNSLTLDADGDTSLTADTDDQINIEIAGADDFVFTANTFSPATGTAIDLNGVADALVLDADADTSLAADTDDQIDIEIGGSDEITVTASTLNLNDHVIDQDVGAENVGALPSICTVSITYTAAAGGNGTVCTIGAGEVWFIHSVYVNVTTNFDATGDDASLVIGDGDDPNGFIDLVDGELQTTDTEITGAPAGWQGFASTDTRGAFLAEGTGFVESGAETVDYLIDETSGETLSAGAATIYVVYTRIQ